MKNRSPGFTLVEVIVALVITVSIGTLGLVGMRSAHDKSKMVVEINAARNLISAYMGYCSENSGRLLPGYKTDPTVTNLEGKLLHFPMNARYPWRLAPSVPKMEGVMVFNGTEDALLDKEYGDYLISAKPNLGLNATLVGGHFGSGSPLSPTPRVVEAYGKFYGSGLAEVDNPSGLIVFLSARGGVGSPGYFEVRSPNLTSRVWSSKKFVEATNASDHGFVDMRWGGKAVAAMLGGNVDLLDEAQLRDMRRWSNQAAQANQREFLISTPGK